MTTDAYTVGDLKIPHRIHSGFWREGHIQGIVIDPVGGAVYWSFTTILLKTDLAGTPLGSVGGIVGHLGCITLDPARRRVYGSLEFKHDAVGAGIMARTGKALAEEDAFYLVSFDMDRITRMDMDAEADGVMTAVYLPDVVEDFMATDAVSGARHRYGCSGIDGTALGPVPGAAPDSPPKILIAYGIYSDTTRKDNDHQVILQFDPAIVDAVGKPLSQLAPHHEGSRCEEKLFFYTGNTTYGVQNLEYDPHTRTYMAAVYPGNKPTFANYPFYFIDAASAPAETVLCGRGGERGLCLSPKILTPTSPLGGCAFPWGSTGMVALGDGLYAFSHDLSRTEADGGRAYASEVCLYCLATDSTELFAKT